MDGKLKSINLSELREGFAGKPLFELINYHLNRQSQRRRVQGVIGTIATLPEEARGLVEGFIDRWNLRAYDQAFWQTDTASVFDDIIEDAKNVFSETGLHIDDEKLFNMFSIIVLGYACNAYDQPKMREFMGIKDPIFPWVSAICLLYPIGSGVYFATQTPANLTMIVGCVLADLGYLLIGAGIVKGTFRIFGLKKRWLVLVAGVIATLVGTFLLNIGAY